jgi:hypothetical protein
MTQDRYTKLARNQPCQVRLPGCDGGGETTVAAHYRSISLGAGIGIKPQSWLAAHACAHCHNIVDGRAELPHFGRDAKRLAHAEGVMRTLLALVHQGEIDL